MDALLQFTDRKQVKVGLQAGEIMGSYTRSLCSLCKSSISMALVVKWHHQVNLEVDQ